MKKPKIELAKIKILKGKKKNTEFKVQFNPPEYTLSKSNEFANVNIPGLDSPLLQFTRGGLQTLTVELLFDTYEEGGNVKDKTKPIEALMEIDPDLHAPPVCEFSWGKAINSFTCVVTQISKKFTMFNDKGIPVRATFNVTFSEYKTEAQLKKPRNSPDRTKVYTPRLGDSLWSIAAEEYGDPSKWRAIADANDLDNPRYIPVDQDLIIPKLEV